MASRYTISHILATQQNFSISECISLTFLPTASWEVKCKTAAIALVELIFKANWKRKGKPSATIAFDSTKHLQLPFSMFRLAEDLIRSKIRACNC